MYRYYNSYTNCLVLFGSSPQNAVVGTAGVLLDKGAEKSPTKARQPRKVDLRARYWAFLFDNLRRAVDEIYVTCESDQSVVECKVSCVKLISSLVSVGCRSYLTKQEFLLWVD